MNKRPLTDIFPGLSLLNATEPKNVISEPYETVFVPVNAFARLTTKAEYNYGPFNTVIGECQLYNPPEQSF